MYPPSFEPEMWDEEENKIWREQGFRCIVCGRYGDTLHEIIPKSKAPKNWRVPENRCVVCAHCHNRIHKEGAKVWRTKLEIFRDKAVRLYGDKK